MTMTTLDDFYDAWKARFPNKELPENTIQLIRLALNRHRERVDNLDRELRKEKAVVDYLEKILKDNELLSGETGPETGSDECQEGIGVDGERLPAQDDRIGSQKKQHAQVNRTEIVDEFQSLDSGLDSSTHTPETRSTESLEQENSKSVSCFLRTNDEESVSDMEAIRKVVSASYSLAGAAVSVFSPELPSPDYEGDVMEQKSVLGDDSDVSRCSDSVKSLNLSTGGHSDTSPIQGKKGYSRPVKKRASDADVAIQTGLLDDLHTLHEQREHRLHDDSSGSSYEGQFADDYGVDIANNASAAVRRQRDYKDVLIPYTPSLKRSDTQMSTDSSASEYTNEEETFLDQPVAIDTIMRGRMRSDVSSSNYVNIEAIPGSFAYRSSHEFHKENSVRQSVISEAGEDGMEENYEGK